MAATGAVTTASRIADADWPTAQHDVQRTGAAEGTSNLAQPAVFWSRFMGGNVGLAGAVPVDIDGDGTAEVAYVVAGRLSVARQDGTVVWRSDNYDLTQITGVADVTGDRIAELVAQSTKQVYVFAADGDLVWAEPADDMGTIGGARVGDVDGDGTADIFVQECNCCLVRSGKTGFVYTLLNGIQQRVLTLPFVFCGGASQMMIADLDGDGDPDLPVGDNTTLSLLDGATGTNLGTTVDMGDWTGISSCAPIDIDGVAPTELVCTLGLAFAPPGLGHRMYALRYGGTPATLQVLWTTNIGDLDATVIYPGVAVDFDGDGRLELPVSGTATGGSPVTRLVDAQTGAVVAGLAGQQLVGVVHAGGKVILLTQRNGDLVGSTFDGAPAPAMHEQFVLPHRRVLPLRNWTTAAVQPLATQIATLDLNGDGVGELLTIDSTTRTALFAYDLVEPGAPQVRQLDFGSEPLAAWGPVGSSLMISTSDGIITFIDSRIAIDRSPRRVTAGGYFDNGAWLHLPQAPVVGKLGDGADRIVMTDSRRSVIALDASTATNLHPPDTMWNQPFTVGASITHGLSAGDERGIACRQTDFSTTPQTERAVAIAPDGTTRWQTAIGVGVQVFSDVITGNFDGDSVPDVLVQWGNASDSDLQLSTFSGSDGHLLWTRSLAGPDNRVPAGASIADWNGDGRDDVVVQFFGLYALSGIDGSTILKGGLATAPYFLPTLHDVDGDTELEVSLSGGQNPLSAYDHALQRTVWQASEDDRPFPYAAYTRCSDVATMVSTSLTEPARVKLTAEGGGGVGTATTLVLAGGNVYPDATAATADGAELSQLTSVQLHGNLLGTSVPMAVIGSAAGYLYAFDPCTGDKAFSLHFDGPVGAVAFGDTDGDGLDELIASVGDGFLYGIKNAPVQPPTAVRDIAPNRVAPNVDIDSITTTSTLAASWDPVPGATGYEVAIADRDGHYMTSPPWTAVGDVSTAVIPGLALTDGERYRIGVRSTSAAGVSPDVDSDGVTVTLAGAGDGGVGGDAGGIGIRDGGCCDASPEAPIAPTLLVGFVLFAMQRRRRRAAA